MAILDSFNEVVDDDQLNDGYFNDNNKVSYRSNIINALNIEKITDSDGIINSNEFKVDQENFNFDLLSDTTKIDSIINTSTTIIDNTKPFHISKLNMVYHGIIYDDFPDTSIDTTLWTLAGEDSSSQVQNQYIESQEIAGGGFTIDNTGASGINLKPIGTNSEIILTTRYQANAGSVAFSLKLRDESANEATLKSVTPAAGGTLKTQYFRIVIDSSNATLYSATSTDGSTYTIAVNTISLASLSGNTWFIRVQAGSSSSLVKVRVHSYVYVNQSSPASQNVDSTNYTITSSDTGVLFSNNENISSQSISHDNGSNFSTTTNGSPKNVIGGTQPVYRFTLGGSNLEKLSKVFEYGAFYD